MPESHAVLVDAVRRHYGVLVTASTSEARLRVLERGVRAKLKIPAVPALTVAERVDLLAR